MDTSKMEDDLFTWLTEGNGVDFTLGAKDSPSLDLTWCTSPPNQDGKYDLPAWMESREDVGVEKYNLFEDVDLKDLDAHGNWINCDPPIISLADSGGVPPLYTAVKDEENLTNEVPISYLSNETPVSTAPASTVSSIPASVFEIPASTVPSSTVNCSPFATIIPSSEGGSLSDMPIANKTSTSTPRVVIKVLKVNIPSKSKGVHVVPCGNISSLQSDTKPENKPQDKNTCLHPTGVPQSNCLLTPPQSPGKELAVLPSGEFNLDSHAEQLMDELVNMVGPETAEFDLDSSIHTLGDVDELLSHLDSDVSESEPPSPLSSQNDSLPSSHASPDMMIPSPASPRIIVGSTCGKAKSARTRRSEPYVVDLKQRKKEQNKRAAHRYRQKKKQEEDSVAILLKGEEEKQQELKNKYRDLKQELGYLKKLMRDVFIAKGVISPKELK